MRHEPISIVAFDQLTKMLSILNTATDYKMANRKTVFDIIEQDEKFSILLQVLNQTGFGRALRHEKNPFTFFAPTDGAFYQFFNHDADRSIDAGSKILITSILGRHLIPGLSLYSDDLRRINSVKTMEGTELGIYRDGHRIFLNGAQILSPGTAAANGVVFAIDKVFEPEDLDISYE